MVLTEVSVVVVMTVVGVVAVVVVVVVVGVLWDFETGRLPRRVYKKKESGKRSGTKLRGCKQLPQQGKIGGMGPFPGYGKLKNWSEG